MRLFGRVTVYGEYLMHKSVHGLIIPSKLYLATHDEHESPIHREYKHEMDNTLGYLSELGLKYDKVIRGNLPLGYGFSSSTILSYLRLSKYCSKIDLRKKLYEIDKEIHGFSPSGVDLEFCFRQCSGLYRDGVWTDLVTRDFDYSIVIFPKYWNVTLSEVQYRILRNSRELVSLAESMNEYMVTYGTLMYSGILRYSVALLNSAVYNNIVERFITSLLQYGIAVKGIGGLYDKAVLIFWPERVSNFHAVSYIINSYRKYYDTVLHFNKNGLMRNCQKWF